MSAKVPVITSRQGVQLERAVAAIVDTVGGEGEAGVATDQLFERLGEVVAQHPGPLPTASVLWACSAFAYAMARQFLAHPPKEIPPDELPPPEALVTVLVVEIARIDYEALADEGVH